MFNHSFDQPSNSTFQSRFNSSFPTGPANLPRPVHRPQRFLTNSQVFRQTQPNRNILKPNINRTLPQPTPTPTSRVSFNPQHNSTSYQQPKPNWIAGELYNTETQANESYVNESYVVESNVGQDADGSLTLNIQRINFIIIRKMMRQIFAKIHHQTSSYSTRVNIS
nr:unnamed protein product [Callosobruchus chinensis]